MTRGAGDSFNMSPACPQRPILVEDDATSEESRPVKHDVVVVQESEQGFLGPSSTGSDDFF